MWWLPPVSLGRPAGERGAARAPPPRRRAGMGAVWVAAAGLRRSAGVEERAVAVATLLVLVVRRLGQPHVAVPVELAGQAQLVRDPAHRAGLRGGLVDAVARPAVPVAVGIP